MYMLLQGKTDIDTDIGPRAWYFARAFRRVQNIMPEGQYQCQYQFCTAITDLFHGPWCIDHFLNKKKIKKKNKKKLSFVKSKVV